MLVEVSFSAADNVLYLSWKLQARFSEIFPTRGRSQNTVALQISHVDAGEIRWLSLRPHMASLDADAFVDEDFYGFSVLVVSSFSASFRHQSGLSDWHA